MFVKKEKIRINNSLDKEKKNTFHKGSKKSVLKGSKEISSIQSFELIKYCVTLHFSKTKMRKKR